MPEELKTRMLLRIQSGDNVCLLKYQQCLGFAQEPEPVFFNQESLRSVCVKLQLQNIPVRVLKQKLGQVRHFTQMATLLTSYVCNGDQQESQQFYPLIQTILTHFSQGGFTINTQRFLGKLDFETNKVKQLERFYIQLLKQVKQGRHPDLARFLAAFQKTDDHALSRSEFEQLLQELQMVSQDDPHDERVTELRNNELAYFLDEYDPEEAGQVLLQRLEADFLEFVAGAESVLERVSDKVYSKIADNA